MKAQRQSWGMMGGLHVGRKYEPELSCVEMKLVSTKKKARYEIC